MTSDKDFRNSIFCLRAEKLSSRVYFTDNGPAGNAREQRLFEIFIQGLNRSCMFIHGEINVNILIAHQNMRLCEY